MKRLLVVLVLLAMGAGVQANDNLRISGFGSIVAGQVLDGSGFVADYPNVGAYDDQFDISQETRMGVQANVSISDELSATMQVMSRASNEYEAEVEWLFVNYAISDDLELQAGKLRVPVYYYSEYMDVGIAYPWVRVPSDAYSLDLVSFDGLQLNHRTYMGGLSLTSTLFTGRSNPNEASELMSYIFGGSINREFSAISGAGFEVSTDSTIAKITYSQAKMKQVGVGTNFGNEDGTKHTEISFIDVFLQQNFGPASVMLEYNDYDPFYSSYFVTATYTLDMHTFYVMNSKFTLDGENASGVPYEEHDTNSIGVRCNVGARTAIKFDLSMINDTGVDPINHDPDGDGDATIFTTSLDFMF